jgi:hypothetical protein
MEDIAISKVVDESRAGSSPVSGTRIHIVPEHISIMPINEYMKKIVPLPEILKISSNIYVLNGVSDRVDYRFKWRIVNGELESSMRTYDHMVIGCGLELEFLTKLEFMEDWFEYFI